MQPALAADVLTEREVQILRGMADGRPNAEIGENLWISEDTVKTHARRLFKKLGARDRAQAVRIGFDLGYLNPAHKAAELYGLRLSGVQAALRDARSTRTEAPDDSRYAALYDAIKAAAAVVKTD